MLSLMCEAFELKANIPLGTIKEAIAQIAHHLQTMKCKNLNVVVGQNCQQCYSKHIIGKVSTWGLTYFILKRIHYSCFEILTSEP